MQFRLPDWQQDGAITGLPPVPEDIIFTRRGGVERRESDHPSFRKVRPNIVVSQHFASGTFE